MYRMEVEEEEGRMGMEVRKWTGKKWHRQSRWRNRLIPPPVLVVLLLRHHRNHRHHSPHPPPPSHLPPLRSPPPLQSHPVSSVGPPNVSISRKPVDTVFVWYRDRCIS